MIKRDYKEYHKADGILYGYLNQEDYDNNVMFIENITARDISVLLIGDIKEENKVIKIMQRGIFKTRDDEIINAMRKNMYIPLLGV